MQMVLRTTAVAAGHEVFTSQEKEALDGFLAGYSGLTFEAYQLDLRQWVQGCAERQVALFCARGADIESFGRHLEACGRARATARSYQPPLGPRDPCACSAHKQRIPGVFAGLEIG
jgi:hypothetical protein